jgi:hypothetical protein
MFLSNALVGRCLNYLYPRLPCKSAIILGVLRVAYAVRRGPYLTHDSLNRILQSFEDGLTGRRLRERKAALTMRRSESNQGRSDTNFLTSPLFPTISFYPPHLLILLVNVSRSKRSEMRRARGRLWDFIKPRDNATHVNGHGSNYLL